MCNLVFENLAGNKGCFGSEIYVGVGVGIMSLLMESGFDVIMNENLG